MAQRMTPAQARAAAQRAQREYQRAVNDYNRKVREHNAAVNRASSERRRAINNYNQQARAFNTALAKAVNDHNRAVRNYNSAARAHNAQVANQRARLRQELNRLNSRSAATTFTTYRASTHTFVDAYTAAENSLAAGGSAAEKQMLDLVSDEAANSVYLANALDGDADVGADFAEDELDAPSMQAELARFGPDLVARWVGALYALNPRNPDAARHFCTSAREVVISIIDLCAPDNDVAATDPGCARTDSGAVTRRAKVTFLLRRRGINTDAIAEAVDANVNNVLSLFRTFNDATHGHAGRFTIGELSAIRTRVESAIGFLHTLTSGPAPS